jgi:hypothetical protein
LLCKPLVAPRAPRALSLLGRRWWHPRSPDCCSRLRRRGQPGCRLRGARGWVACSLRPCACAGRASARLRAATRLHVWPIFQLSQGIGGNSKIVWVVGMKCRLARGAPLVQPLSHATTPAALEIAPGQQHRLP